MTRLSGSTGEKHAKLRENYVARQATLNTKYTINMHVAKGLEVSSPRQDQIKSISLAEIRGTEARDEIGRERENVEQYKGSEEQEAGVRDAQEMVSREGCADVLEKTSQARGSIFRQFILIAATFTITAAHARQAPQGRHRSLSARSGAACAYTCVFI
jgi:hypothetical protein